MAVKNKDNYLSPRTINFSWLLPVLNNLQTPPVAPNDGARYRVTAVATNAWAGKENNIAIWDAETQKWIFQILTEGQTWYDFTSQNWHYMSNAGVITTFDKIPLAISDTTGLQSALDGKASTTHKSTHATGSTDAFLVTDLLDAIARVDIRKNGVLKGVHRRIDFIEGTNITLTITEDVPAEKTNVIINAASGGSIFLDDAFEIENAADPTKIIAFNASLIPPATTRTLKAPNADGTIMTLENSNITTLNGDVMKPSVDGQGNIGNNGARYAKVKAVIVESGDLILTDKKTGKRLYAIHEDKKGIYFSDYRTGKAKMFLNMKTGDLKITGKLVQNAKITKKLSKSPALKS